MHPAWKPTLQWHFITLGILLAVCTAGYIALSYISAKLPAPYQPHTPAAGTTPWKTH